MDGFIKVQDISQPINGRIVGNHSINITKVEHIDLAKPNHLTFIGKKKYIKNWKKSRASAAIVNENFNISPGKGRTLIFVPNVDIAVAKVLEMFRPRKSICSTGIHHTAVIDSTAVIGEDVSIGAGCYIGPSVNLGEKSVIYPNVTILGNTSIGREVTIWPGVVIREGCKVGNRCIIHPSVTIGADGFGFTISPDENRIIKIPHIDVVEIGDDVEIGAGSCIDRGKHTATVVGDGTKIDNLVQIGHNCKIGQQCMISGSTGIAGSVVIGNDVMIGGGAGIRDHVRIGDRAQIGARSGVIGDIKAGAKVSGIPAHDHIKNLKEWIAIRRLPNMIKKNRKLNKTNRDLS